MLYAKKFPQAKQYTHFVCDHTKIVKLPQSRPCVFCQKVETSFQDVNFQLFVCSEECDKAIWDAYHQDIKDKAFAAHMDIYKKEIKEELGYVQMANDTTKDIIIVVHDQLSYLKGTIQSLLENTKNFHLWIWDNASGEDTQKYLHDLMYSVNERSDASLTVMRSEENLGFIEPNNELIQLGSSDYVILLNSDVQVFGGWDQAMLGWLQNNLDTKIVGYAGGLLDDKGIGGRLAYGYQIDYVPGWCLAMERSTYQKYGLFNSDLKFAYAEDSDLSIRIQTAGHRIYALHLLFVHHFQNKTIETVKDEGEVDVRKTFYYNHEVLRKTWGEYLSHQRIDVRSRKEGDDALDEIFSNFE